MSYLDRILLVIFSIISLAGAVFLFLLGLVGFSPFSIVSQYPWYIYAIVIAIVWFVLGLRFLFYRIGSTDVDYVVLPGEFGNIRISFETIRQLANRTGKTVKGVAEFDTRIRNGQQGIWLAIRVRVLADMDLNAMSKEIQVQVKEYVEQTTGVTVERVTVHIAELASQTAKVSKAWVD